MKVCVIAAYPKIPGGQAVQAFEIIGRLKKEGLAIDVFPVNPSLRGVLGCSQKIKYLRTLVNFIAYLIRLLQKIPEFDVLHVFSASYFSFLLAPVPAVFIGKLLGKKIILNYHSGEAEDHLRRSLWIIKKVLKQVDTLVVPSLYLKNVFERFGFHAEVVFNVVDLETFRFRKRERFQPRFLVNRSLEPMYNVDCVIRAFQIIQESYPGAELVVVGSGREEIDLKNLAEDLKLKNVLFAGGVEHQKMPDYFSKADIFLNASNIDNMPISILEAFSSGLPVISTNAGGIPYMVDDSRNGLLVNLNDHEAMAKRAIFLLNNPEVASRMAHVAREDCEKLYSWRVNKEKWLRLYNL